MELSKNTEILLEALGLDVDFIKYKAFLNEPLNENLDSFIEHQFNVIEANKVNLKESLDE